MAQAERFGPDAGFAGFVRDIRMMLSTAPGAAWDVVITPTSYRARWASLVWQGVSPCQTGDALRERPLNAARPTVRCGKTIGSHT
ncbi:hypothetical protein ATCCBAA256_07550 [Mycobacterium montefiorense]|nr:hypothetical protein ATCCBAA256_07550 [Mycobacterium montefiorense]